MRRVGASCVFVLLASLLGVRLAGTDGPSVPPLPEHLRDTGLYADWDSRQVDASNLAYAPVYPLWSDGAAKSRWLHLPAGSWIDASNADAWQFPVGTKVWKEFRFNGAPAETRFIERTAEGWRYASYAWRPDGTATLVPERGILNSVQIREGVRHAIPSRTDCTACHEAGPSRLLSVSTLQLSSDRDPMAPHAEPVPQGGATLATLAERGLVRGLPSHLAKTPARIEASTAISRAAMGYLHANCGMCHTGAGEMASLGFSLQYTFARPAGELAPALRTTIGQPSHFQTAAHPEVHDRIAPGSPDRSMLIARMASRHPVLQMPPLGTRVVDAEAVDLLRRWITEDTRQPQPANASTRPEATHARPEH